jgi:hypothetical protein
MVYRAMTENLSIHDIRVPCYKLDHSVHMRREIISENVQVVNQE